MEAMTRFLRSGSVFALCVWRGFIAVLGLLLLGSLASCGGGGGGTSAPASGPTFYLFSSTPGDGEIEIPITAGITLDFVGGEVDASTAAGGTVSLSLGSDAVDVAVAVAGSRVTVVPRQRLAPGTSYVLRIGPTLRNTVGALIDRDYTRTFRTEDFPLRLQLVNQWATTNTQLPVVVGDFNGDGINDVAMLLEHPDRLAIYLGARDGSLAAPLIRNLALGNCALDSMIGTDVNRDGRLDLVISSYRSGNTGASCKVQAYLQGADGQLTLGVSISTNFASRLQASDMNGDGLPDLVGYGIQADPGNGSPNADLAVMLQRPDGTFSGPTFARIDTRLFTGFKLMDFNGDGRVDVLLWGSGQSQAADVRQILHQRVDGQFDAAVLLDPIRMPSGDAGYWTGATATDLDGDGRPEVIATGGHLGNSAVVVYKQDAQGRYSVQAGFPAYSNPQMPLVADMDRDGRPDLVTIHPGWLAVSAYLQQSSGALKPLPHAGLDIQSPGPGTAALGDLNGDGLVDIAISGSSGLIVLYQVPLR